MGGKPGARLGLQPQRALGPARINHHDQLGRLLRRIRDESLRRHLIYLRDGQPEAVHVMPCPVAVLPDQLAYIHVVTLTIQNALKRLPELYFQDFAVIITVRTRRILYN